MLTFRRLTLVLLTCSLAFPVMAATVNTPTFSPSPTNFARDIKVTINCSTSGAKIRYTTNGYDPTSSAQEYKGPLTLTQSTTLKVRAFKPGMSDSYVATGVYKLLVGTPKFAISPGSSFDDPIALKIECPTSGATIRYTTNGYDPTASSREYKGPITLMDTVTVKARGFKQGMADSVVALAKYLENNPDVMPVTSTPRPDEVYPGEVEVKLECRTTKAVIRYTTNGSDPTASSPEYKGPFKLTKNTDLRARAFKLGKKDSPIAKTAYKVKALAPVFKYPIVMSFNDPCTNQLECPTAGAEIRYTMDGDDPTDSSTLYCEPIEMDETCVVKARAYADDMEPSDILETKFTETFPDLRPVEFKPEPKTPFEKAQGVELWSPDPKASIHFTLDGSEPTENSPVYKGGLVFTETMMIRAKSFKPGKTPSIITQALYQKMKKIETPYFDPRPGTFDRTTDVAIKCDTPDVSIYYTLDGSEPTRFSETYDPDHPLVLQWTERIRARAYKLLMIESDITEGEFQIKRKLD